MRLLGVSVNDDLEEQKTASIPIFTGCPVPSKIINRDVMQEEKLQNHSKETFFFPSCRQWAFIALFTPWHGVFQMSLIIFQLPW